MLVEHCICGSVKSTPRLHNGILMALCECGVWRQCVNMTPNEYRQWYAENYLEEYYYHTAMQDRLVANMRLNVYNLPQGTRLLDVGAAKGIFVQEAMRRGIDAWGQDLSLSAESDRVYARPLEDIHFPSGSFDTVTMHDVLEHVPNPRAMLKEIARILAPNGQLIVDFPRFHHEEGKHHWKHVEHLWMLDEDQLCNLLRSEGFNPDSVKHPIPSKVVAYTRSVSAPSSVRILVPPGIGDGYWVLVKLRSFLAQRGIVLPELWVHDSGPRRSGEFWNRVPFVRFAGYAPLPATSKMPINGMSGVNVWRGGRPVRNPWTQRAYHERGFGIQTDVPGFDFFLSVNGELDNGGSVDEAMPGEASWYEPLFCSKQDVDMEQYFKAKYGRYVVTAFWEHGHYSKWLHEFSEEKILVMLREIQKRYTVIMMGADWDANKIGARLAQRGNLVSLVGETTFGDLTALLRGSCGVLGFPAGNTLLGPYFRKPTVILWEHFPRSFWSNCVPPDADKYRAVPAKGAQPINVAAQLLELMDLS